MTLTTGKSLHDYENMAASTIEECDRLLDMINTMLMSVVERTQEIGTLRAIGMQRTQVLRLTLLEALLLGLGGAAATSACWAGVISANIGSEMHSRAKASARGKAPGRWPSAA